MSGSSIRGRARTWVSNPRLTDPDELITAMQLSIAEDIESEGMCPDWPDIVLVLPDEYEGDLSIDECVLCGKKGFYDYNKSGTGGGLRHRSTLWARIFHSRQVHEFQCDTFCDSCASKLPKYILRFRDIDELNFHVNKLQRAIYERKRNQDNWPTSDNARQRSQRSAEWRSGYREGYRSAQAGEKHLGIALLRNKNCDVQE
jgi:hypothetical protein